MNITQIVAMFTLAQAPDPDSVRLAFDANALFAVESALALVMFGVALELRLADFKAVFSKPRAPIAGLLAQLLIVPACTYLLILLLKPTPSIALGMILIAACPSGTMSNFITHLAKGNTALSVTLASFSTMIAVVTTPLLLGFWGGLNEDTRALLKAVEMDWTHVASTVFFVLGVPMVAGMLVAARLPRVAARLQRPLKILSVLFLVVIIVVSVAQNFDTLKLHFGFIAIAVILENSMAMGAGYGMGWLMRLPDADRRALTIEVGIHNSALGLTLIFAFFDGLGGMALVAGTWSVWHLVAGLGIATYWSRRPPV